MTYEQLHSGKPLVIESGSNHSFACCTCGLVHRLHVTAEFGGKVSISMTRDNRATAGVRRGKKLIESLKALVKELSK